MSFDWSIRAISVARGETRVYARNHTIACGAQVSLDEKDARPSALELLLAALASDLLEGLRRRLEKRAEFPEGLELTLSGELDNVLVHLGVIGEAGHAGLKSVKGTLYASAEVDESALEAAWQETLAQAPVYQTISRAAEVAIALRIG